MQLPPGDPLVRPRMTALALEVARWSQRSTLPAAARSQRTTCRYARLGPSRFSGRASRRCGRPRRAYELSQ